MKKGFWIVVKDMIKEADVILEILDARMPDLTRNKRLEQYVVNSGKRHMLMKGGIIDERIAAIQLLTDWHNGRIRV